jgi:hypothetical protein
MNTYFIDYENVHESGLEGIMTLNEEDMVYIFYNKMTKSMPFERGIELARTKATVDFIETHKIAKNYLDFQLSTFLGYLIGKGETGAVYVISKDSGFDSLIDFWKKREITICRQESIVPIENTAHKVTVKKTAKTKTKPKSKNKKTPKTELAAEILQENVQIQMQAVENENSQNVTEEKSANPGSQLSESEVSENPENEQPISEATDELRHTLESETNGTSEHKQPVSEENETPGYRQLSSEAADDQEHMAERGKNATSEIGQLKSAKILRLEMRQPENGEPLRLEMNPFEKEDTANPENIQPEGEEEKKKEPESMQNSQPGEGQQQKTEQPKPEKQPGKQAKKQPKPDLPEAYRKKVRAAVKPERLAPSSYTSIYKAIVESPGKVELNNAMVKIFNTSKGGRIYGLIKNIYAEYQKDV